MLVKAQTIFFFFRKENPQEYLARNTNDYKDQDVTSE